MGEAIRTDSELEAMDKSELIDGYKALRTKFAHDYGLLFKGYLFAERQAIESAEKIGRYRAAMVTVRDLSIKNARDLRPFMQPDSRHIAWLNDIP